MAKTQKKFRALTLRKQGFSIGEIALKLKVSKSTVSTWCKDIALSGVQINSIALRRKSKTTKALLLSSERQRTKRLQETERSMKKGAQWVHNISKRDVRMICLGLYWGEGYKTGSQEFGFTNSDSEMIVFYIDWLKKEFNINKSSLILRISINELHKVRENEVITHWSKLTGVPKEQFTKTSFIKTTSKKIYPNAKNHFGTLRVKVRNGTVLRRQVLGAIAALKTK